MVELLQQPPQGLDVLIVIRDIGIVEIDKVAHALSQFAPLLGVHHHVLATLLVIVLGRDVLLTLLVVDIGLGDAEFLLHAQLDGQSVCIPSGLTLDLKTLHGLVAVERILNSTRKYVVNTGVTVGRGRSLEENELGTALTLVYRAPEYILLLPTFEQVVVHLGQVQAARFGKLFSHFI